MNESTGRVVRNILRTVIRTDQDAAPAVLRLALGLMILPHGAQKLLGWFGGPGLEGTIGYFSGVLGIPAAIAVLVVAIEFFGGIALVAGLLSRVAAVGVAVVMIGAVVTSHADVGFFMNWSGSQAGEGWEFHLLAVGIAAAVALRGGGFGALDRLLARRLGGGTVEVA